MCFGRTLALARQHGRPGDAESNKRGAGHMPDKARQNALRACARFYFSMPPGATRATRSSSRHDGRAAVGRGRAFRAFRAFFLPDHGLRCLAGRWRANDRVERIPALRGLASVIGGNEVPGLDGPAQARLGQNRDPSSRCVGTLTTAASGRPCRPEDRAEQGSDLVPGGELFAPMPRIPAEDLSIVLSAARSLVAHCRLAAVRVKSASSAAA